MNINDIRFKQRVSVVAVAAMVIVWSVAGASAQTYPPRTTQSTSKPAAPPVVLPPVQPDFVIGPEDVLRIDIMDQQAMSGEFLVRPDGKIVMLQIDELTAAGLKPEELKKKIKTELKRFFEDPVPEVFVQVKTINSRKVFMQGTGLNRQGPIALTGPMTIIQAISLAGGLQEFADRKNVLVISGTMKDAKGAPMTWKINYDDLEKGKNLGKYNITLQPGDTVIVRGG
jgi:polysaccharide biosynthesis/export protein